MADKKGWQKSKNRLMTSNKDVMTFLDLFKSTFEVDGVYKRAMMRSALLIVFSLVGAFGFQQIFLLQQKIFLDFMWLFVFFLVIVILSVNVKFQELRLHNENKEDSV